MYKNLLCYDVVYHIIEYVKGKVVELKNTTFSKKFSKVKNEGDFQDGTIINCERDTTRVSLRNWFVGIIRRTTIMQKYSSCIHFTRD